MKDIFRSAGVNFSEAAHRSGTSIVKAAPEDMALAIKNLEQV